MAQAEGWRTHCSPTESLSKQEAKVGKRRADCERNTNWLLVVIMQSFKGTEPNSVLGHEITCQLQKE